MKKKICSIAASILITSSLCMIPSKSDAASLKSSAYKMKYHATSIKKNSKEYYGGQLKGRVKSEVKREANSLRSEVYEAYKYSKKLYNDLKNIGNAIKSPVENVRFKI